MFIIGFRVIVMNFKMMFMVLFYLRYIDFLNIYIYFNLMLLSGFVRMLFFGFYILM